MSTVYVVAFKAWLVSMVMPDTVLLQAEVADLATGCFDECSNPSCLSRGARKPSTFPRVYVVLRQTPEAEALERVRN